MVQPAASAGATLQAIWLIGQFQGVMKPQTPIGLVRDQGRAALLVELEASKRLRSWRDVASPAGACAACASQVGAPISSVMVVGDLGMRLL